VGYREGELDYLTVLMAQRTYFQSNLAYLDALGNARKAAIEIDGFLLTGSLRDQK
jgi:cobalt-zinc-cadmium efflux system outer membrane protein